MTKEIYPYDLDDVANDIEEIRNILTCIAWWFENAPNENTPQAKCEGKAAAFASCAPVYHSVLTSAMAIALDLKLGVEAALEKEGQA